MAAVPKQFLDLAQLLSQPVDTRVNIIGMVVDVLSPRQQGGGDWTSTMKIMDQHLYCSGEHRYGIRVKFWVSIRDSLPKINALGDIMLFRNAKFTHFRQEAQLAIDKSSQWMHFPLAKIPAPEFAVSVMGSKQTLQANVSANMKITTQVTLQEQNYVIELRNNKDRLSSSFDMKPELYNEHGLEASQIMPASMAGRQNSTAVLTGEKRAASYELSSQRQKIPRGPADPYNKKFRLVKDVGEQSFADMCVEVIKKWVENDECRLLVTDYTEHQSNFCYPDPLDSTTDVSRDGDQFGYTGIAALKTWPGPWGHHILKVTAKYPHAQHARQLDPGDIIRMKNVKITLDHRGVLEGTLWQDKVYPDKQQINVVRDTSATDASGLRHRRAEYLNVRRQKEDAVKAKQIQREHQTAPVQKSGSSRKARSKANKQKAREAEAAMRAEQERVTAKGNRNVHCAHEGISLTSLRDILDEDNQLRHINQRPDKPAYVLPFVNANFRTKVKVTDFTPDRLEDFAVPIDCFSDADVSIESSQRWEWAFQLHVQDATSTKAETRAVLNVGHEQAQYLFGNDMPDPDDLRRDGILLAKLREKMFLVWGDLEEQKKNTAASLQPNNTPFECCVLEYGVLKQDGDAASIEDWSRQYMLHGITTPRLDSSITAAG